MSDVRRRHQLVDIGRRLDRVEGGHAGRLGRGDRARLVAGELEHLLGRADERDAGDLAGLGQVGVLRQEAVAGIDRVGAGFDGGVDDRLRVEIGADRVSDLADLVGLVSAYAVLRSAILDREDGDSSRAELVGGTERTDRDLTAICHENLLEHGTIQGSERTGLQPIAPHVTATLRGNPHV